MQRKNGSDLEVLALCAGEPKTYTAGTQTILLFPQGFKQISLLHWNGWSPIASNSSKTILGSYTGAVYATFFLLTKHHPDASLKKLKCGNRGNQWACRGDGHTRPEYPLPLHTLKPHHFCASFLSGTRLLEPPTHPFLDSPAIPCYRKTLNLLWVSSFHEAKRVFPVRELRGILSTEGGVKRNQRKQ